MIHFSNTIDIPRSAREVYDYLVDLEHLPEWNWAISETTKLTPGPVAVGTRFAQTRTAPRRQVEHLEIAALTPQRRIEIRGTLADFRAQLNYELTDNHASTTLTNTVTLEADRIPAPARRLLASRIERSVASNLRELRSRLTAPTAMPALPAPPTPHAALLAAPASPDPRP